MFAAPFFPATYWDADYFDKAGDVSVVTLLVSSLLLLGVGI